MIGKWRNDETKEESAELQSFMRRVERYQNETEVIFKLNNVAQKKIEDDARKLRNALRRVGQLYVDATDNDPSELLAGFISEEEDDRMKVHIRKFTKMLNEQFKATTRRNYLIHVKKIVLDSIHRRSCTTLLRELTIQINDAKRAINNKNRLKFDPLHIDRVREVVKAHNTNPLVKELALIMMQPESTAATVFRGICSSPF